MVTMEMADEDMVDPPKFELVAPQLQLGSFAAIDQKKPLIYIEYMSGKISS